LETSWLISKMKNKCCCCESESCFPLYINIKDKEFNNPEKFSIYKCNNCGFEFTIPSLNEKQLSKFYPADEYYSYQEYNRMAFLYHKISAYYYSRRNVLFNFLFFPFKQLLYPYYIKRGKNILEVGCGNGMKLEIYNNYQMKTFGIEPYGKELTLNEKRLGIQRVNLNDCDFKENSFDYIILKEVLEHVPDQKLVLSKCYRWLKPDGVFIITVPNVGGLWNKIFKDNWYGYDIPRHIYNYNKTNIRFYLKKFGYKKIKTRIYDMPYMLDGSIKYYLTSKTGKRKHPFIFSNFMKIIAVPVSLVVTYLNQGSILEVRCSK